MKPMRLRCVSLFCFPWWEVAQLDVRYEDEADHEDSTGLLLVGDVASADAEDTGNDVWRDLGRR